MTDTRTDAEDDGEDAAADEVERDGGIRLREVVLLVVAVLGIAGTVVFGLRWKELHDDEVQRQDVEESAGQFLNALFEWDGATIDEDFDRILSQATGEFADQAQDTFNDDETRRRLREENAGSRADDVDIFVRSIQGDRARVFAVVDVTAASAAFPDRRADTVRVEIGMVKEGGDWKVDDVNLLDGLQLGLPADTSGATEGGGDGGGEG